MTTVLDSLNAALHDALSSDPSVVILGEDVLDPYGGAFKVTRGLSTAFPDRVRTTPVSEAAIVGVASGMALRGLRPVVEIMFGDFTTLVVDQLVNHAAKFRWMFNEQVRVPIVVRTPMGGRRGYGPTHSQSLEKLFLGIPGLRVLAPAAAGDPGALLRAAIADEEPVLFVEHKAQYATRLWEGDPPRELEVTTSASAITARVRNAGAPEVTIVAYGHMADLARVAVEQLAFDHEMIADLVIVTQLAPLDVEPIAESAERTGRVVVVEEGTRALGWGAEVLARLIEVLGTQTAGRRVAAPDMPVPACAPLEDVVLPGVEDVVKAALELA